MPSRLSFDLSRPLCRAGASRLDLSCPQHPHSALRIPHSVVQRLPPSAIHFRGFPLCHADASPHAPTSPPPPCALAVTIAVSEDSSRPIWPASPAQ
eukprot:5285224-Prymnesium_polylepis.1